MMTKHAIWTLALIGHGADEKEDNELARSIEKTVYLMANRKFGEQWFEDHSNECVAAHADPVECWKMLVDKIEGEI